MALFKLDREMGYARDEFFAQVPRTFRDHAHRVDGDTLIVDWESGQAKVTVGPQAQRKIALLRLPYIPVSIRFEGLDDAAQERFLRHFDTSFQKGGG